MPSSKEAVFEVQFYFQLSARMRKQEAQVSRKFILGTNSCRLLQEDSKSSICGIEPILDFRFNRISLRILLACISDVCSVQWRSASSSETKTVVARPVQRDVLADIYFRITRIVCYVLKEVIKGVKIAASLIGRDLQKRVSSLLLLFLSAYMIINFVHPTTTDATRFNSRNNMMHDPHLEYAGPFTIVMKDEIEECERLAVCIGYIRRSNVIFVESAFHLVEKGENLLWPSQEFGHSRMALCYFANFVW